jgi:hypothetical protein
VDNKRWNSLTARALLPPFVHEIGLVDNPVDKTGAQQGQQVIAVFGSQEVVWAGSQAAMQPVDPVQALDDAYTSPAGSPKPPQVSYSAGKQYRLVWGLGKAVTGLIATRSQTSLQLCLEGSNTASVGRFGDDADT